MADSDSTNATVLTLGDITGELETVHHALRVLNDITRDITSGYSIGADKDAVFQMFDRIAVMTSATDDKLNEFDKLVQETYKIQFSTHPARQE